MAKPKYKIWQNKSDDDHLIIEMKDKDRNFENVKAMLDEFESRGWYISRNATSTLYHFKRRKDAEPCENSSR